MIFCFDLDGTLCHTKGGDYENSKPKEGCIRKVNTLYHAGHTIIIDTARGSVTGIDWRELTERQLEEWRVRYHTLYVGKKTAADVYIDDKAVIARKFFEGDTI